MEEFDKNLMATILYYYDLENKKFRSVVSLNGFSKACICCEEVTDGSRYGPPGIIRYTKNAPISRKSIPTQLVDSCRMQ